MAQPNSDAIFDPAETGATLREARESLNRNLSDIAEELRIRESYLEAIEEGRLSDLPGPAYTSGFLRSYGDYLKLDGSRIAMRYKSWGGGGDQHTSLSMPSPVEEGRLPTGSVMLIAGVLAMLAYSIWYYMSSSPVPGTDAETELVAEEIGGDAAADDEPVADGAESGADPAQTADDSESSQSAAGASSSSAPPEKAEAPAVAASAPAAQDVAAATPKARVAPPEVAGPSPIQRGRRASTVAEDAVATAETETAIRVPEQPPAVPVRRVAPPVASEPATPAPATGDDAARTAALRRKVSPPTIPAGPITIVVRAKSDSWVEVRKGRDTPVLSRLMRVGETFRVPSDGGYTINTGNAGAIEILVNGRAVPPIGKEGQITRDVALDARQLLGGQQAPSR